MFIKNRTAAVAIAVGLALGGAALAGAAAQSTDKPAERQRETALTGDTAAKVKAAALDKVPGGTVERVESDRDGTYEAHVTKTDGSEVEVKVDKAFKVTAVEQHGESDRE